jgi:hypothetical protein
LLKVLLLHLEHRLMTKLVDHHKVQEKLCVFVVHALIKHRPHRSRLSTILASVICSRGAAVGTAMHSSWCHKRYRNVSPYSRKQGWLLQPRRHTRSVLVQHTWPVDRLSNTAGLYKQPLIFARWPAQPADQQQQQRHRPGSPCCPCALRHHSSSCACARCHRGRACCGSGPCQTPCAC